MENRVALVTGSTSGIGKAIANQLASEGFSVVYHSRSSIEEGAALASQSENASYIQADLSNQTESKALIEQVSSKYGRLDVLVNNAALTEVIEHADLKAATPEIWRKLYEVNVISPWTLISEAESMLKNSSSENTPSCILNISSHAGIRPKGASIPYSVTKAALNHMTKLLALNLGPNIRVNAIAPGLVHTPMSKDWAAARELWQNKAPMKRGAQPEEIAYVAAMLINSSYLTGEIILSDGGLNLT
ncbi:SDR family NAD(P)-dependent oxidoreductase [Marinomonas rhizomae]|uniref:NAD(P)-dependent dehydrogenase (Short-subunit alcohol dehydrogenase family) n=1 Tax=Marinomonas rhizomae TaxID=491948 RepID=A0A366J4C1_9GAMM|nr:SDR family oxidoreductase [Marinomonas rhizomae]RBP81240.1 NAD(P)-dependent dehydrogenase (short-subunit alcohol dehydrogenase family) [Marinomonas rhizomae]